MSMAQQQPPAPQGPPQPGQGPGGQPPPQQQQPQPPQLPPEVQAAMALPTWEEVVEVLQDRFERSYRIDIETNSTVDLEATEDKAQIAEFMNAWGQMMSGIQPLIESGAMPFEAAKLIMGEVFRRFRFARKVEQALDLMQQPQPPEDPKAVKEKHDAEMMKVQAEAKRTVGEMQETVIENTKRISELSIENARLKAEQGLKEQALGVDMKSKDLDGKLQKHQMQTDYTGKLQMQQQQAAAKEQQLKDKMLQDQVGQMFQAHQQKVEGLVQPLMQSITEMQAAEQEDDMKIDESSKVIKALADNQAAMMQAIQQVAAVAGAEREAEIFVGPDGKKRSRSRVVLQ
jgi:hypothetical protein